MPAKIEFSEEQKAAAIEAYRTGVRLEQIATEILRCSVATAWSHLKRRWGAAAASRRVEYTEAQKRQIIDAYQNGASAEEMRRVSGCSTTVYLRRLKEWGVVVTQKKSRTEWDADAGVAELVEGVMSRSQVADKYGVSLGVIARELDRRGLDGSVPRGSFRRDTKHDAFANLRSDPVAQFWAGLIATDGCLMDTEKRRRKDGVFRVPYKRVFLGLHRRDEATVRRFAEFVGGAVHIQKQGTHVSCVVGSDRIFDDLKAVGITPRKTVTLDIEDWLIESPDFIRGAVCGDGGVYQRGQYNYPTITMCGASSVFITKLHDSMRRLVPSAHISLRTLPPNVTRKKRSERKEAFYVIVSQGWRSAGVLIEALFATAPAEATLDRKQTTADAIISAIRDRRRLAGEREWDRLNAEELAAEDDPQFHW